MAVFCAWAQAAELRNISLVQHECKSQTAATPAVGAVWADAAKEEHAVSKLPLN